MAVSDSTPISGIAVVTGVNEEMAGMSWRMRRQRK